MKTTYQNFTISAIYKGEKSASWDRNNKNHYKITVKNNENNKKTSFDFWCSIMNPELKDEKDLINAFYCFLTDAEAGTNTLSEFYKNYYGFDKDLSEAINCYNGCRKAYNKFMRILDNDIDKIYSLLNNLIEIC